MPLPKTRHDCTDPHDPIGEFLTPGGAYDIDRMLATIMALRKEHKLLTHKIITCGVAASHPDASLSHRGAYAEKWDSQQAQEVRALRKQRDELRDELTAATAERSVVDGANGSRAALEIAALTKTNRRQATLVLVAEAAAEEQRLSSDAGWERVHKLEDELKVIALERDYALQALMQIEHVTADARKMCAGDVEGEDLGMRSAVTAYELAREALKGAG